MQTNFPVLVVLFMFLLPGCNEPVSERSPVQEPPSDEEIAVEKVAVLAIVGNDSYPDPQSFNRWNYLEKSKHQVHVFAPHQDVIASFEGSKHVVASDKLGHELATALANAPERAVIFFEGHGAPNGNWCYTSEHVCDVTEDVLIDALKGARNKLKHVLIIPASCFNKVIMDRFAKKLEQHEWPFAISYLSQTHDHKCGTQSVAENLMNNLSLPLQNLTEPQIDKFLTLSTLNEMVEFHNSLLKKSIAFIPELTFKLRHHKNAADPKLSDFGFDVMLAHELFAVPVAKSFFPQGRSVQSVLQEHGVAERFNPYIKQLQFTFADHSQKSIEINGDVSKIINEPHMAGKTIRSLHAIISPKKMD